MYTTRTTKHLPSQRLGGRLGLPGRPRSAWAALHAASSSGDDIGLGAIAAVARGAPDGVKLALWVRASLNEHALSGRVRRVCEDRSLVQLHYQPWALLADEDSVGVLVGLLSALDAGPFLLRVDPDAADGGGGLWPTLRNIVPGHAADGYDVVVSRVLCWML